MSGDALGDAVGKAEADAVGDALGEVAGEPVGDAFGEVVGDAAEVDVAAGAGIGLPPELPPPPQATSATEISDEIAATTGAFIEHPSHVLKRLVHKRSALTYCYPTLG